MMEGDTPENRETAGERDMSRPDLNATHGTNSNYDFTGEYFPIDEKEHPRYAKLMEDVKERARMEKIMSKKLTSNNYKNDLEEDMSKYPKMKQPSLEDEVDMSIRPPKRTRTYMDDMDEEMGYVDPDK